MVPSPVTASIRPPLVTGNREAVAVLILAVVEAVVVEGMVSTDVVGMQVFISIVFALPSIDVVVSLELKCLVVEVVVLLAVVAPAK